jgi:hypothetical protein
MSQKPRTKPARPVVVPPPAPPPLAARRDAETRDRIAMFDRLADRMRAATRELDDKRPGHDHPANHSALCLTCGAAFDIASGFCVEERPERVEIPYETCTELEAFSTNADLSPNEAAARLISVGLYVLGRGGHRGRNDLFELWEEVDKESEDIKAVDAAVVALRT